MTYSEKEAFRKHFEVHPDVFVRNEDGIVSCLGCSTGAHQADEYSIPDCAVLGCNCCCAGG
ncbi:MAG: hypothetical protein Q7K43_03900 [Candidatus Woesearchaeota archaeon]|nr:hypothetical protein [Candidatus Woesearchaeota archaeon]